LKKYSRHDKIRHVVFAIGYAGKLRDQIIDCALDRACLYQPWPKDAQTFETRRQEGKAKLGLLAQEVARLAGSILTEWNALTRKLAQAKPHTATYLDLQQQISQLVGANFITDIADAQLTHLPRYLKAAQARVENYEQILRVMLD